MKSGGVRITVNYRKLNKLCELSQLAIPRVDDTLDKLLHRKNYSLFDMKSSSHQIKLHRHHPSYGVYHVFRPFLMAKNASTRRRGSRMVL